jgi:hypothetical protein
MSFVEYNIKTRTIKGPIDDVIEFVNYIKEPNESDLFIDRKLLSSVEYNFEKRTVNGFIDNVIHFVNYIHKPL